MRKLAAPHRPTGWERFAFRAPILLYQAHLGWLLGGRFMRRRVEVDAAPMPPDEGGELMARYAVRHDYAARKLCRFMGFEVDGGAEDYRLVGRELPFVRFAPVPA